MGWSRVYSRQMLDEATCAKLLRVRLARPNMGREQQVLVNDTILDFLAKNSNLK